VTGPTRVAAALFVALAAVACGGDKDVGADAQPAVEQAPATATPTASASASAAATPAGPTASNPMQCADPAGDSTGVLDLTSVELKSASGATQASFAWTGTVPTTDSVLWTVTVSSRDGETARQLGYKIVDGALSSHFMFDFGTSEQIDSDAGAALGDQSLTAGFPAASVDDLGEDWTWKAALSVAGSDVDLCEAA
jgi:hypothetical protein